MPHWRACPIAIGATFRALSPLSLGSPVIGDSRAASARCFLRSVAFSPNSPAFGTLTLKVPHVEGAEAYAVWLLRDRRKTPRDRRLEGTNTQGVMPRTAKQARGHDDPVRAWCAAFCKLAISGIPVTLVKLCNGGRSSGVGSQPFLELILKIVVA
jgi:hypothetical protein